MFRPVVEVSSPWYLKCRLCLHTGRPKSEKNNSEETKEKSSYRAVAGQNGQKSRTTSLTPPSLYSVSLDTLLPLLPLGPWAVRPVRVE